MLPSVFCMAEGKCKSSTIDQEVIHAHYAKLL
jgi:hypothetical protein